MRIDGVRRSRRSYAALTGVLAVLFSLSVSGTARAQTVGLEFDLGIPVGDTKDVLDLGWGLEGRVGLGLPIPAITFEAEALFDWYSFPFDAVNERLGLWRAGGGLRVGLPIPFVPEIFGHVGYGNASSTISGQSSSQGGFTWDVGLAANLFSIPLISVGIHIAYKVLAPGDDHGVQIDPTTWVGLGLHGEIGF